MKKKVRRFNVMLLRQLEKLQEQLYVLRGKIADKVVPNRRKAKKLLAEAHLALAKLEKEVQESKGRTKK